MATYLSEANWKLGNIVGDYKNRFRRNKCDSFGRIGKMMGWVSCVNKSSVRAGGVCFLTASDWPRVSHLWEKGSR